MREERISLVGPLSGKAAHGPFYLGLEGWIGVFWSEHSRPACAEARNNMLVTVLGCRSAKGRRAPILEESGPGEYEEPHSRCGVKQAASGGSLEGGRPLRSFFLCRI